MEPRPIDPTPPPSRRARWWLIGVAAVVLVGLAATNPGRAAHLTALGNPTHTGYHNYGVFSTTSHIGLDGQERPTSVGLLGTVYPR